MPFADRLSIVNMSRKLSGATVLLACALMVGRGSGIVRELVLAAELGTSAKADYAVVLLTLPDLFVSILIAGGLSAVLVPQFRIAHPGNRERLFWSVSAIVSAVFAVLALIFFLVPEALFSVTVPGLDISRESIGYLPLGLVALSIPFAALSGVTGSYLNALNRYFMVGLGALFFNLSIILALLMSDRDADILLYLAFGVLFGAGLRWLSQIILLPRSVWRLPKPFVEKSTFPWGPFFAAISATTLTLFAPIIVRAAASSTGVGAVASLNYAQKLVDLPVGVLFSAIYSVALTQISGIYADEGKISARRELSRNLRQALTLAIFAMLGSISFALPVVQIAFDYGAMTQSDIEAVSALFFIASLSLPAIAYNLIMAAYLNATGRATLVFRTTLAALMTMPLLVLPGIVFNSINILVWASVVFQVILASLMFVVAARSDDINYKEALLVLVSKNWAIGVIRGSAILLSCVLLDHLLDLDNAVVRLGMLAASFGLAVMVSCAFGESGK